MKKIILFSILIAFVIFIVSVGFLLPNKSDARQGCCSHHGGVCGCGCCDGTSLSATCAPYYPQCNRKVAVPEYNPPTPSSYDSTNSENYGNSDDKDYGYIWWILGFVGVGGLVYFYIKDNKK